MKVLVVAEHDGTSIRAASLSCFTFARQVADATGGSVTWLVLGDRLDQVASQAARLAPVLVLESPQLAVVLAEPFGRGIAAVVQQRHFELVCAASTTYSKDVLPRAAALLGGAMASDVVRHEATDAGLQFECPKFAGSVTATLRLIGWPQIVTVRASSYPPTPLKEAVSHNVSRVTVDAGLLTSRSRFVVLKTTTNTRPDVTEARVVVSAGRAVKDSEGFEKLVGQLADLLGGAVGSSRALVDAGIASNALQIGQTGKIVAPDLYIALGISGAVQHLAGMRNSRTIAAINSDPNAPIFDVADIGIVGDIYELVPELIEKLRSRACRDIS